MAKVLVITPVFNKIEYTAQAIRSLQKFKSGIPFELVIVNNQSTDGTEKFLREKEHFEGVGEKVYAIWNEKNRGFSIANNQGVKLAKEDTEFYCFLNNDVIVTENWLKELVECAERHEKCGIVGARLLHPGSGDVQHAGVVEKSGVIPSHIYFGEPGTSHKVLKEKKYPAVTGACMLVKRDLYEKLGGFDEAYWCGWEDIDLCKKASKLGYEIWYAPKSVVYHYEGSSEGRKVAEDANSALYLTRWALSA